jgi:hypothetical protein
MQLGVTQQILTLSVCVAQKTPSLHPHPDPAPKLLLSAFDWLGADFEIRSLCYWPTSWTENQSGCLINMAGEISPPDVIKTVLH